MQKTIFTFKFWTSFLIACFIPFQIHANNVKMVRVGYPLFEAYQELSPDGSRSGYGYEYIEHISDYTGWHYQYISCTWNQCIQMLKKGEIDILSYVNFDEERTQIFDFPIRAVGECYGTLSIKTDNHKYYLDDVKNFNTLRVGMNEGNIFNKYFEEYCKYHNIQVSSITMYPDKMDAKKALQEGEVDAIVTSSMTGASHEKPIAKFGLGPYYIAVAKGKPELLEELNYAMLSIYFNDPGFQVRLYNTYYNSREQQAISLTRAESDFLKSKKKLRAVTTPNASPISYFENGIFKGIIADIMEKFSEDLDIEIEYIPTKNYDESLRMVQENKADFICNFYHNYGVANNNGIKMSIPYMNFMYVAITKRNQVTPKKPSIAITKGDYYIKKALTAKYSQDQIFSYDTFDECLMAIKSGTHDITYLKSSIGEKKLREIDYRNLQAQLTPEFNQEIAIGVNQNLAPLLPSILNKEIQYIGSKYITQVITEKTLFQKQEYSFLFWIYDNSLQTLLIVLVVLGGIILILIRLNSQRKGYSAHFYKLAYCDDLTHIRNGNWLQEEGQRRILKKQLRYSIISVDISKFNILNDYYSREIGDKVLQFVASVLLRHQNEKEIIARIEADHFLMLLASQDAQYIRRELNLISNETSNFTNDDISIRIKLNYGICPIQEDDYSITKAIDYAEMARRMGKSESRIITFFDANIKDILLQERKIEDHMEKSLTNNEFIVYYQPQYDMGTEKVIGAEGLIRWIHPTLGFMNPGEFIPLFEKNGFVIEIDFFVLEETCKMLRRRLNANQFTVPISVNQSRIHLNDIHYQDRLESIISKYDIPKNLLKLEITETSLITDSNLQDVIRQLKAHGFIVSMDDFGSGYSSLTLLNSVQFDVLKIDKALLGDIAHSERTRNMLKHLMGMAKDLNTQVICEGVETKAEADFIQSIGCQYAQGFLYAKPMALKDFEAILNSQV